MIDYSKCPDCGCWHDAFEGSLIQTENPEETRFVCLDCFERFISGGEDNE